MEGLRRLRPELGEQSRGQIAEQPLRLQLRHSPADEVPAPRGKSVMGVGMAPGAPRARD
jgi:hypothetical protein